MNSANEFKTTENHGHPTWAFSPSPCFGFRLFALGVIWLPLSPGCFSLADRDQVAGLPPRKGANRLIARSIVRLIVLLSLLGLSSLAGELFLFGVLTGFLLQVMAYTGQALYLLGRLSKSHSE